MNESQRITLNALATSAYAPSVMVEALKTMALLKIGEELQRTNDIKQKEIDEARRLSRSVHGY